MIAAARCALYWHRLRRSIGLKFLHVGHGYGASCFSKHRQWQDRDLLARRFIYRETLLTFFDFSADPSWAHLRTTNPIESVFTTIRRRTVRMKDALSQDTARLMVFKLVMETSNTWRRLHGQNPLPKVVKGFKFRDGIEVVLEVEFAA